MLRVDDLLVRFGGVVAVDRLSMDVPPAAVTGLIGPNGSGKTTTFDVVNGLRRPTRGRVLLRERDITGLTPAARARLGIARTFQRLELFGNLSVRDNVLVASESLDHGDAATAADALLERLGLAEVADAPADVLPTGLARLVELARALARRPRYLLVDEPGSGLDPDESAALADLLTEVAGEGVGVLVVEHDMDLVMRVCRTIYVLDVGRLIAAGTGPEIQRDPVVQRAYLGRAADHARPVHPNEAAS